MPVSNLLKLGRGAVVPLDHRIGEPVDVVVNGRLIARGEVVLIEDETTRFGVSLTEIIEPGIAASSIGRDPPPMNWSILRYVFGHQEEDHKCRESITSPRR